MKHRWKWKYAKYAQNPRIVNHKHYQATSFFVFVEGWDLYPLRPWILHGAVVVHPLLVLRRFQWLTTKKLMVNTIYCRWWFQIFFMFTRILGEMIQFDVCIFFRRVGSTTTISRPWTGLLFNLSWRNGPFLTNVDRIDLAFKKVIRRWASPGDAKDQILLEKCQMQMQILYNTAEVIRTTSI